MAHTQDISIAHTVTKLHDAATPSQPPILLVFINGLMLPRALWQPTLSLLPPLLANSPTSIYALTYDRYGQGESRKPSPWKAEQHDLSAAAAELESLLCKTFTTHPDLTPTSRHPTLILISHSIGVPLARLHNATTAHPATAHLFLDSNISNTDFVSIFPDPDAADFDPATLPEGTTIDDLRGLRERTKAMFHPSVPNPEGLNRSTVSALVPHADQPKLRGPIGGGEEGERGAWLTVVGHDPVAFAEEGLRLQGTPVALNYAYMQPVWDAYNEGLVKLVEEGRAKGVVIAKGAGHFVQRDNPTCVAEEIVDLVNKVIGKD
ncbi:uncharacterized protein HMPREF1541_02064 [Cyphellophora europaea CBS 101466]|uniref:AB hydrolase-1 domain-containing protein n=1 Tax=Cyphellophora europaea (strain CBS 101466) TaxID=1220924 RepID=W2S2I4_CYPE1|nr:uncharacterized protein HMPREF1541_02064 [Cyphellophora europaea CBS 101466]ETN42906.1 hypothetical protein HMPREF1541_02064 [Cyphellophora europaea CBS 101466]